jgi:hypothetical protein
MAKITTVMVRLMKGCQTAVVNAAQRPSKSAMGKMTTATAKWTKAFAMPAEAVVRHLRRFATGLTMTAMELSMKEQ